MRNTLICAYCGEIIKEEDLLQASIWSVIWKDSGYKSPLRNYHKSRGCAGFDQFAHEG